MLVRVSQTVRTSPGRASSSVPLFDLGMESFEAAEILEELEDWLKIKIPSTIVFDVPTIHSFVQQLLKPVRQKSDNQFG